MSVDSFKDPSSFKLLGIGYYYTIEAGETEDGTLKYSDTYSDADIEISASNSFGGTITSKYKICLSTCTISLYKNGVFQTLLTYKKGQLETSRSYVRNSSYNVGLINEQFQKIL